MKHLFWSGPRESDIFFTNGLFEASVTFYGSNRNGNSAFCSENEVRINHNTFNQEASDFILKWQLDKVREYPDCMFMAYNPNCVIGAPEEIVQRTICLNDVNLMRTLDNKLEFRLLAKGIVPLLDSKILDGCECQFSKLQERAEYEGVKSFIVQELKASGGYGTHYFTAENETEVRSDIQPGVQYLVSAYRNYNIPLNIHVIIYDRDILVLPGSIQIIQKCNNRLLYRGADYKTYQEINETVKTRFKSGAIRLAQKVQKMGYRGILGFDALLVDNEIFFLEANNRFQGSSILLNKALSTAGLPSLQQMNYDAFLSENDVGCERKLIEELEVPYSLYTFIKEADNTHSQYMYYALHNEKTVNELIMEGYHLEQKAESLASQFSVIFDTNIVSLCEKNMSIRLHPNLAGISEQFHQRILNHEWTALKVAILNRGAVLSLDAIQYIEAHGKMRNGTYCSLDLYIKGMYINCPLYIKLTALSPFAIDLNDTCDALCLKYYGRYIVDVTYDVQKNFYKESLENGTLINKICFLATDRLRIQNNSFCTFPVHGIGCLFCEANGIHNQFEEEDILEAIDVVFSAKKLPFRHIMIGGLSNHIGYEKPIILNICQRIRKYSDMPIYLMSLPPLAEEVEEYYRAGVTEFGFNLEIYDRSLAQKYMPGKGYIPIKKYMDAYQAAVHCVGNRGAVRCAFIVGLEPKNSLLEGIEKVCQYGVAPILSVFRPIPGTVLENMIPPSDEWLFDILQSAEAICKRYHLSLGPTCPACRNNTLSYAEQGEVDSLGEFGWRRDINEREE